MGRNVNLMEYEELLRKRAQDIEYGFWVADTTRSLHGINSSQLISKFDHYIRKFGDDFGLMIVDYTSLLEDGGTDWNDLKKVTRRFKIAAHNLGKPILQVAQAKRGARGRKITREDIGYAWGMVEDSDKVFAISRERHNLLSMLCDKNRGGEEGWTLALNVDPDKGKIIEVEGSLARSASF
jgi:replicative DNA helicase